MSLISKIPIQSTLKTRRIPNAFMLFVKDQKGQLVQKCPEENMTVIGRMLGKKWKAMGLDEKRVYYEKYNVLKRHYEESSASSIQAEEDSMDKDLMREITEISQMEEDRKRSNNDFTIVPEDNGEKKKSKNHRKSKEGKRKSQGRKNPFLIFAQEHRGNINTSHKGHSARILGNMWQDLDISEKKKYFDKAKRPYSEEVPSDVLTSGCKSRNKTKKKKEPKPDINPYASENGVSSSKKDTGILDKKENLGSTGVEAQHPGSSAQSCTREALQSVYRLPQSHVEMNHTSIFPYSHNMGGSTGVEAQHPGSSAQPCTRAALQSVYRLPLSQAEMNPTSIFPYSSNMGGFYRPSFYPPDSLWMYQQAMFPPTPYYPFASHCHCCPLSIRTYPAPLGPSSYFRSVIYGRTNTLPTGVSAEAVSSDAANGDGVSDDEENRLVIVDDSEEHA